jgi:peptidoglycan hydrolase-like protein with peptidoglycan-binding domain
LIAQLGKIVGDGAKPSLMTDAVKVISKTFGGPPSTPGTGPDEGVKKNQQMLNSYFGSHVLNVDGYAEQLTTGAIKEFQKAEGLEATGTMDSTTHDLLVKRAGEVSASSPKAGFYLDNGFDPYGQW